MSIIAGIIILSISILVHELGHLVMGKLVGIRPKIFSFGYGKGIFMKTFGDTTYQITAIPLGGYVQFYGDDLMERANAKPGDFFYASPMRRIVPVIGGPLFNLLLGVLIFAIVNFVGMDKPSAKIMVPEKISFQDEAAGTNKNIESPAYSAGLRNGDLITKINDKKISSYADLKEAVVFNNNSLITVEFKREERFLSTKIKPITLKEGGFPVIGVSPFYFFGLTNVDPKGAFGQAGLKKGDILLKINGQVPKNQEEVVRWIQISPNGELTLTIKRGKEKFDKKVVLSKKPLMRFNEIKTMDGRILKGNAEIFQFDKMAALMQKGLIKVDDQIVKSHNDLLSVIKQSQIKNSHIKVSNGNDSYLVKAKMEERFFGGVGLGVLSVETNKVKYGFFAAIGMGFVDAWDFILLNLKGIAKLFSGQLSVEDNLSGPIRIAKIAGDIAEYGIAPLFLFLAQISVVLMVMNLLPIPVVDGGHIIFFLIEAAIGKPINVKVQQVIMSFFVFVLIAFGVFVIFNDLLSLDFMQNLIRMFG